jgi:hypothetical protein
MHVHALQSFDVDRRATRLRIRLGMKRCAAKRAGRLAIEQVLEAPARWPPRISPSRRSA